MSYSNIAATAAQHQVGPRPNEAEDAASKDSHFLASTVIMPRVAALADRFPGNVRLDLLDALLASIWASLMTHLKDPVRVEESDRQRAVTFMGAARFTRDKDSRWISVSQLEDKNGAVVFVVDPKATAIDLPARLSGFWLDPFLVPWRRAIADCLIDHQTTGSGLDWMAALKHELQRALRRSTHWFRLRCALRDALQLDPKIVLWCRKGRPATRNYITHVQYNNTLAERATYERIEADNPNLVWLYNVLRVEKLHPTGDQPVAEMKAWLLAQSGIGESGWRLIANGKEQDFRHVIDFVDENGGIRTRHEFLPKWVRLLGKLRRNRAVPKPLLGMFEHDTYDGGRFVHGDNVQFRDVVMQPGVLRAVLEEGERRLVRGSHKRFIEEEVVEVLVWLEAEQPVLDKNQLGRGWKYLAARAVAWKLEREACETLQDLCWKSLLPETRIGPWRVVPLTDAWQLRGEALTRRLCADQHLVQCLSGQHRVFSVRTEGDRRVATIGLERQGMHWSVFGFRGFANRPVNEALVGLDVEVLRRYEDLWQLSVPVSKPLPPPREWAVEQSKDGACPYCSEAEEACAHTVAIRDLCSRELIGGTLCAAYDELHGVIEAEIRHAAENAEFRFGVYDEIRLLAWEVANGTEDTRDEGMWSVAHQVGEMILDWLAQYCEDVRVIDWDCSGGGPGMATTYRRYSALEPAAVVEWLKAQFQPVAPLVGPDGDVRTR